MTPLDHVGEVGADGAVHGAGEFVVGRAGDGELAVLELDLDAGGDGDGELALGALEGGGAAVELELDSGGDRDRLFADSGHGSLPPYQTWQSTSPPTWAARASRSDMTPRLVESTAVPMPPRTRGMSPAAT